MSRAFYLVAEATYFNIIDAATTAKIGIVFSREGAELVLKAIDDAEKLGAQNESFENMGRQRGEWKPEDYQSDSEKLIQRVSQAVLDQQAQRLTKREEFAKAAMQAIITGTINSAPFVEKNMSVLMIEWKPEHIRADAYKLADAMLKGE